MEKGVSTIPIMLVVMKSDSEEVVKNKEILVMPENVEDVEWYGTRNNHRMYVDVDADGVKTMMYWPWDLRKKTCELPSVAIHVAAEQVVEFMKNVKSNSMQCHGNWNECQDMSKQSVDTQGFFKEVMKELNERRKYKKGQDGALTDAFVLAHLCCGKKSLLIRYGEWLPVYRK